MKNLIIIGLGAVCLLVSARAETSPDEDLSRANDQYICQRARAEAIAFWNVHKNDNLGPVELDNYVEGRAAKHNLAGLKLKEAEYANTWREVLTQLRIDGE